MELPLLDCHAHIATSVTDRQLHQLGSAVVFAMTRNPEEAVEATRRYDPNIVWACGAHPSFVAAGGALDLEQFVRRTRRFALVGEVGLDRRSGNLSHQERVFADLIDRLADEPVLLSVHSAGCSDEVLQVLTSHRHAGVILHWFTGSVDQVRGLADLGYYFSVNTAMRREVLEAIPLERLLPETDFPVARKRTGTRPGDTAQLEELLGNIHHLGPDQMRRHFYRNLRRVSVATGAIDRMPAYLTDLLLTA